MNGVSRQRDSAPHHVDKACGYSLFARIQSRISGPVWGVSAHLCDRCVMALDYRPRPR